MRGLKKIAAGLIAAAIMMFGAVPAVYAEDDAAETGDTIINTTPVLSLSSSKSFEVWAGVESVIPIEFKMRKNADFSYADVIVTGGDEDIYTDNEAIHRFYPNDMATGFTVKVSKTCPANTYSFTANVAIYDSFSNIINTQSFIIKVTVKTSLKVKGLTIESYTVSKETVSPGDSFDITVVLKNNCGIDVKNAELTLEGLDSAKFVLDKGFTKQYVDIKNGQTGSASFSLIAQNGISLVREVLSLKVTYSLDETGKKTELERQVSTSVIIKCQPNSGTVTYGAHDLAMTKYTVSSNEVTDGTRFTLTVDLRNNGAADITGARVSVGADGTKFSIDTGLSYCDFSIRKGETKSFVFRLMGCSGIASQREALPVVLEYGTNSITMQASVSCKGTGGGQDKGKYDLSVTGYSVDVPSVSESTVFNLTFDITNSSAKNISKARVSVMNLDGTKFAIDSGLNYSDFDIAAGETKTFTFRLIGCHSLASIREVIPIQIDYGEVSATSYATVKCVPKDSSGTDEKGKKIFAPNIIIESYEFGGDHVTAGVAFPLSLIIKNVSSSAVIENLKVTINGVAAHDGSIAFSPANSSNSFFFETLDCKSTQQINMDMLPKADAVPNSYPVDIAFTYEYSVNNERYQASGINETITIPLRQEDRLVINEPETPGWAVNVGEMCSVSMSLVNKGKSAVYNVTATVEGDGFNVDTPSYYIGNINSGVEEYYDAKITPLNEGEVSGDIIFTYEDSNGESKEKRVPFRLDTVSFNMGGDMGFDGGMYDDGMMPVEDMGGEQNNMWIWFAVGGAVLAAAAIIIIVVAVKKKKKKAELEDDDEDI